MTWDSDCRAGVGAEADELSVERVAAAINTGFERVLVVGANGPTGRLVVQQALDRGFRVEALTRHPAAFPIRHDHLHVTAGDATDPATMDAAVARCDAVISVIGVAYTRRPVEVYSATGRLVVTAMGRHGLRRLVVVTASAVAADSAHQGRFLIDHVMHPLLRRVVGRTVYDDMARMEATVAAADLDWTIVRPPGLTDESGTGYAAAETHIDGQYCARDDLAAFLLDQLGTDQFLRRVAAVASPGLRVSALKSVKREVLKR